MLEEYKTRTNIGVGLGLIMSMMARVFFDGEDQLSFTAGLALAIAGSLVFIWGCMSYARGKGYHPLLGLLGLLYLPGLLVLVLLRDRRKAVASP